MDEKLRMLFVFNPLSGKAQIKNNLLDILDIFTKGGYEITIHPTQEREDAYRLIKSHCKEYDIVVCSGGDGTLNETVRALMETQNAPKLGYIPAGTTNDFAFSVNIPKDMKKAAQNIIDGITFSCDIGKFNGRYFTYVAAFGAFTEVSYETPQQTKNIIGHSAYVIESIKRLHTIKPYRISLCYNDKVIEDEFILGLVTNTVSIGGYRHLNELGIMLDDGLFEVTLVRPPKNAFDLQSIISSVLSQKFDSPYLVTFKTDSLTITSDESINWTLDGENGGSENNVNIENCRQAINIVVPLQ